jgi:hypothetical protein
MSLQFEVPANINTWAESIGGFIINFGSLQDVAFLWIEELSDSGRFKKGNKLPPMKEQIDEIIELIPNSSLSTAQKDAGLILWNELYPLVEERNRIAHNSLNFGKDLATGNRVLTMHDVKKLYPVHGCKIQGKNMEVLQISEIRKSAKRVAEILLELNSLVSKTQNPIPGES